MTQWEYLAFARVAGTWVGDKYDGRTPEEKLSDLGKDGWELATVCYDGSGYNYYLKRVIEAKKKAPAKKAAAKSTKK